MSRGDRSSEDIIDFTLSAKLSSGFSVFAACTGTLGGAGFLNQLSLPTLTLSVSSLVAVFNSGSMCDCSIGLAATGGATGAACGTGAAATGGGATGAACGTGGFGVAFGGSVYSDSGVISITGLFLSADVGVGVGDALGVPCVATPA